MTPSLAVAKDDFGDPLTASAYHLCVYEQAGDVQTLVATAPAGPTRWKPAATGFRYRANDLLPDGLKAVTLRAGTSARLKVTGRGPALPLGALPFAAPIRVRLVRPDGPACWGADYPSAIVDAPDELRARLP
jgi:hypothetical protein